MKHKAQYRAWVLAAAAWVPSFAAAEASSERVDYLSFAQGVLPVALSGDAEGLKVGMEQALLAIDGDAAGYTLTPKPGHERTQIVLLYQLPAATTFTEFAVPGVLETPSPSQTFVRSVEIAGSAVGPEDGFEVLASVSLETPAAKGEVTRIPASAAVPVRWVRVALAGGIDVQREKTFFEFSEIIGYGQQETVPRSEAFTGKWKGRGVLLELKQDSARVSGCYDRAGDLKGTVSGNLLRATGETRTGGIPSTFVLAVDANGHIAGVRSTNGAPFRLYAGEASPGLTTECSEQDVAPLGCGAIIHGINFDFDSADIRPESDELLAGLSEGLKASSAAAITVIGHTSSEGAEAYNEALSQRRAEAVAAAIVERGIDAVRVSAQGRGEQQPIADNDTEAGRSLNRRVEIGCH